MTTFFEISRRARDRYHNVADDVMIKSVFNLGKSKGVVGMKIPDWMITDEIKLTENCQLYPDVFGVDVPTTQSQPTESTQGTHKITSAPRTPNPKTAEGKSSAPRRSTVIRLRIPPRRSTRLTPPTPILMTDEVDDLVLQDTLQVSLAEQKSHEELEATQNVEKVKEHLMAEEIKKLVEGTENEEEYVEVASSTLRQNDNQNDLGTRLEPRSDKESPKVEIIVVVQPVNVNDEEEESAEDDYKLRRREKGKHVEEIRNTPSPTTIRSPRIQTNLVHTKKEFNEVAQRLQEIMLDSLPKLVNDSIKWILKTQVPLHVAQGLILEREKSQADVAKMITDAIQQERENLRTKISSQVNDAIANHIPLQVDSSVRSYMSGHILHVHPTKDTPTSAQEQKYQLYLTMRDKPQLQKDDVSIWLALKIKFERLQVDTTLCRPSVVHPIDPDDPHDDAHPKRENSAKRQKTSEHETFIFGESSSGQNYESEPGPSTSCNQEQSDDFDFWTNSYATDDDVLPDEKASQELMNEISQTVDEAKLCKVVDEMLRQQCTSRDEHQYYIDQMQNFLNNPKAPGLPLVNQDLLYIKNGKSRPEKIILSLHKFPANPHAKIFYIKKQQELGKPKEEIYSNLKIIPVIKTYWELCHEHKFITEVDDYAETGLLWSLSVFIRSTVIWERVHDLQLGVEIYQQKVNLTVPTITFPSIEKYEIVLEGLKSYNNKEDAEYLQLFAEEIEERLKHQDQMSRWKMYVNGRPLGSRRERPE
ncbi:hypothetical protein Tco_0720877 [Tanacetum coccineum]